MQVSTLHFLIGHTRPIGQLGSTYLAFPSFTSLLSCRSELLLCFCLTYVGI
uniref:Uncharacterized protein n=1 Tax=Anguilla anguilla TaxID=7936 RepID=A0A0E9PSV3_ANGAN